MTTSTPEPNQPNTSLTDTNLVEDRSKLSKMYQHYVEVKDKYPHALLLYRVGDFFETFFQDAVTVSRELELVLTSKHGGEVGRVAMTGVPHHAWERYTTQLVEKGYAVVICDQVEDSADAIGLVKREVTRILTPGTLLEEGMLKASRNNYIAAVVIAVNHWGLAYADISTGEFLTSQGSDLEHLTQELMRLQPSEVLFPTNAPDLGSLLRPGETSPSLPQCLPPSFCYSLRSQVPFSQAEARSKLLQKFKVRSLEGLGCEHLPLAVRAAGGLLEYIEDTQKAHPVSLQLLRTYTLTDYLIVDHQTRRNLEITQTVRDGTFHGSLLWALDRTSTAMGSRALRRWLLQPLLEIKGIKSRQDTIQELVENTPLRQDLRQLLRQIYDLERLTVRAASGRANARDLVALADSFSRLPELSRLVADARSPFLKALQKVPPILEELAEKLHAHIVESPPTHLKEGGLIRAGMNPLLDERKATVESDQQWIANLEVDERARTGIPTLKVGFNKTFGYYISISRSKSDQVPDNYIRRQTLTNEERYITPDLKEREARILTARDDLNQLEYQIFEALRNEVGSQDEIIRNIARAVAASDVLCGLAELAVHQGYCRPEMVTGREIDVIDGRHPVVEQSLPAGFFVPNSTCLGGKEMNHEGAKEAKEEEKKNLSSPDLVILTGPNASGKSCYLRQVGLIQLMAQVGSFVPARSAKLGVCDRIFTRVGAVDDLATGQSTFMVEMNETANILNHATAKSLVLLDEIGRGTATFDGLSIAWAVAEYLAVEIKSRTIFATHYHELNELATIVSNVANYQVTVKELPDQIIFLHQVQPGGADKSYGIEAGRLAGLPTVVIQRAKQVMGQIEKHSKIAMGLREGL
ncbi:MULTISPECIES: DNA mismatch repair protein MutS [Nostocales]|jgi:DNA mismatch repair protein MutS|uniref:DNA mismatch repair protein MutS n=1 Tax=Dolichospermum flos-aquae UHCC 0037 TaxID=2590026 RepID=A0ACC7SBW1_DOLFA|nr:MULTISPECIES: DNA mismatch repair protein MutS [Nostocales]QSV74432.1 MAG: DNA mismatch repair protein MutS [Aphanizomenon flos-aquae KM1D3_PB]MBO1066053.1 DNA mismatch repair protein MutS [Anabaena sp. 54]MTJ31303.1 DNA mismatch repair protein MutS [Aphanizomenon sp. UHCC 0183]MTJ46013.1 DNA mismatch repair protein MutS [Dolichospermum flos-aquae UHCC 0037]OBQ17520.1 MAG: DNA mismatch repair protein MutS [Anabaena sp. AL93]